MPQNNPQTYEYMVLLSVWGPVRYPGAAFAVFDILTGQENIVFWEIKHLVCLFREHIIIHKPIV